MCLADGELAAKDAISYRWTMNPPLAWTYPPSVNGKPTNGFSGQPKDAATAQQNHDKHLLKAVRSSGQHTTLHQVLYLNPLWKFRCAAQSAMLAYRHRRFRYPPTSILRLFATATCLSRGTRRMAPLGAYNSASWKSWARCSLQRLSH